MRRRRKPALFRSINLLAIQHAKADERSANQVLKQGQQVVSHWQNEVKHLAFIAMKLWFIAIHKPANLHDSRIQNGFPEMCLVDFSSKI